MIRVSFGRIENTSEKHTLSMTLMGYPWHPMTCQPYLKQCMMSSQMPKNDWEKQISDAESLSRWVLGISVATSAVSLTVSGIVIAVLLGTD